MSKMSNKRRAQVVRALRAAADAIEAGADRHVHARWLTNGINGPDTHRSADDARRSAAREAECIDADVIESWGLYVQVEEASGGPFLSDAWPKN